MRTPEQIVEDLMQDVGDSGISFDEPLPKVKNPREEDILEHARCLRDMEGALDMDLPVTARAYEREAKYYKDRIESHDYSKEEAFFRKEHEIHIQMDALLTEKDFFDGCLAYSQRPDKKFGYWDRKFLESKERRLKKLSSKTKILKGLKEDISLEKIDRAREYLFSDLVGSKRGMIRCPFHEDKTASMDIRNNFFYCYGCNATGDVIDFVMKTENLTFRQAVERLT